MGQEPEAIRDEIEQTRERMTETVDALGYKADVKSRAKESVTGKVDAVRDKLVGAKDSAGDATPSGDDVKQTAQRAVGVAQENPLGLAIGAAAVGFLAGMLIPATRVENEKLGPMADQVKELVKETGHEALHRGKAVVQETASAAADAAKETAQEQGKEHASALQDSAQQSAADVREGVRS